MGAKHRGNGVKGKMKRQITGQKYEYYLKKMSSRKKVKLIGIAEVGQNTYKSIIINLKKFDVARLKVREQLTKKRKV